MLQSLAWRLLHLMMGACSTKFFALLLFFSSIPTTVGTRNHKTLGLLGKRISNKFKERWKTPAAAGLWVSLLFLST
jgi:hypothetical protein